MTEPQGYWLFIAVLVAICAALLVYRANTGKHCIKYSRTAPITCLQYDR
jgi:hypothetical protein